MKQLALAITVLLSISSYNVWAGETATTTSSVRYVKAPRFARPLVEKWIEEYAKTQPGVEFQIAKGQNSTDLSVVVDESDTDERLFSNIVYIGETAVLPITARSSEAARLLEGKHLNAKKLKQLFFLGDEFDDEVKNKTFERITVYSGSNATSLSASFAHNFGEEDSNFRGKRIAGDDLFLNTAITKDPLGVTFNSLSNIFDLQSRHLKSDLTIIGIDVKKTSENNFTEKATLDDVISALEKGKEQVVAVGKVGVNYNGADNAVSRFLEWVLSEGVKYNHAFGLLNLDSKIAEAEREKVKIVLTAQK